MLDKRTKYIAVCSAGIDVDYHDRILRAIQNNAEDFHFKILYFHSFSDLFYMEKHDIGEANIFHLMNYNLIDAVILFAETIKSDRIRKEIIERANAYKIPVISVEHYIEGCYNLNFRCCVAMEEIVEHLIEKHNYRRINFIAGMKENAFSEERLEAYKKVLEKHGIPVEEERIGYGDFWAGPTKKVIDGFLASELPLPEAIVCANDTMAIAACRYLTDAGYQVPEDIAVTGFDGIREALEHTPSITTAKHNIEKTVEAIFSILVECFAGNEPDRQNWIDSTVIIGGSCGCEENHFTHYNTLTRELYMRIEDYERFTREQIAFSADLADNTSFQGIFENLKKYKENFCSDRFWLCIVDDFLSEKEVLADIIEEASYKRMGYSSTMDIMLSARGEEWLGIIDFNTDSLLHNLEEVLEEETGLMFFPLHVLEQTIGYIVVSYNPDKMNMYYAYQFFMSISNALETTKTHQRQQAIIDNLERKYVHDPMTGLYNRRGFYQRLESVYQNCIEERKPLMVVSVDLNGLKPINDTYGHADGDIAITTIGKALLSAGNRDCTCARFGGDEFVVSAQMESEDEMKRFCDNVAVYLDEFNQTSGKPYQVSASIGCVLGVPTENISLDEFIKEADERMYENKVRYHSRSR